MATENNKDARAFDENVDPYYKQGFEQGYWLKKGQNPQLDDIIKRNNPAQYTKGLKDGKAEATREQTLERLRETRRQNELNRDKGLERD